MAQVYAIGRVMADLEPKTSVKNNPYLQFQLAERVGYGEHVRTQRFQVWAWGPLVKRLMDAGVKKGSLIWVSGALELTDYIKKDGVTHDKQLKLALKDWDFVPDAQERGTKNRQKAGALKAPQRTPAPSGIIDGEREPLPE